MIEGKSENKILISVRKRPNETKKHPKHFVSNDVFELSYTLYPREDIQDNQNIPKRIELPQNHLPHSVVNSKIIVLFFGILPTIAIPIKRTEMEVMRGIL